MNLKPQVFIFIGRSGSGKGTQANLLIAHLKKIDPSRPIVYLETGKVFREFIKGNTHTQTLSKQIYEGGGLQPEFLTIDMWSEFFVRNMQDNVHVVIDGTPRKYHEAFVLDSAVKFYKWSKPHVLYIHVSRETAVERLMGRGRADDHLSDINSRLDWFDTDVSKALTFYEDSPDYFYHDVNGERTPEETHKEIVERAGLM